MADVAVGVADVACGVVVLVGVVVGGVVVVVVVVFLFCLLLLFYSCFGRRCCWCGFRCLMYGSGCWWSVHVCVCC